MSEDKIRDYGFTVGFDFVSHDVLYKLVTNFPLVFDSKDSMLQLWAFGARLPLLKDEIAVRRYLALCASHHIKPFTLGGYVGNEMNYLGDSDVKVNLSSDFSRMAQYLRERGDYVHNIFVKSFSCLSIQGLNSFLANYDFGTASLPFVIRDENRRGCFKVIQPSHGTTESEPRVELYLGRDFGLLDESLTAYVYHWFTDLVTSSR